MQAVRLFRKIFQEDLPGVVREDRAGDLVAKPSQERLAEGRVLPDSQDSADEGERKEHGREEGRAREPPVKHRASL